MSCENCEESAYVIDKLAKLLAEIAVIVNGPEPPLTRWSYHDLPEKVRALKQAPPAAVLGAARDAARWRHMRTRLPVTIAQSLAATAAGYDPAYNVEVDRAVDAAIAAAQGVGRE